ncbi:flagellar hook-associated protein FlgK [Herbaspirillum autotrophicum]|uniref:flagellar hook-associated protein FlgK n=1 Tax=Herbaspirillum autotrophicum TaxID=180195 RepID=UPI00067B1D75|nr:flagellar hook-associated protein FlgK [Herbaspirillum autotrophicum]
MATNIFSIGQSALAAAQAAQATTSHNISNATTPGYNRQVVVQSTAGGINYGYGFVGQGTQVAEIKRVYNDFLNTQLLASQTSASSLNSYYAQISQLDNLVADTSAGLSPALQSFFKATQNLASTPNNDGARQAVLSAAQSLSARFQSLNDQMAESRTAVNSQITSNVTAINSYAAQLVELNNAILKVQGGSGGNAPNDLLDQRDQVIANLNKIVKVTTLPQDNGSLSVFIGTGQPLVLGNQATTLVTTPAADDPTRLQVSYQANGNNVLIPDGSFAGGALGGIMSYRSETLDVAQNTLGRVAIALANSFNAQHKLGQDQNGDIGTDFFKIGSPIVNSSTSNSAAATVTATITDASKLTTSDYRLDYDGSKYTFTRLSDNSKTVVDPLATPAGTFPVVLDGVTYSSPTMNANDSFLIKPTVNGAASIGVAITNTQKIAAGSPILTSTNAVTTMGASTTGTGTGVVSAATLDKAAFLAAGSPNQTYTYATGTPNTLALTPPASVNVTGTDGVTTTYAAGVPVPYSAGATISSGGVSFILGGAPANGDTFKFAPVPANNGTATISPGSIDSTYTPMAPGSKIGFTFDSASGSFAMSPAAAVSIKHADGSTTTAASGSPVPYVAGDTYTVSGVTFTLTGQPANGDQFFVGPNTNGVNDNRNAQALNALQTANTVGNTSFQGSYSQLVSMIGNKTNEISVTNKAENARLQAITLEQQSESGVNQDEELANMIKNQLQYQAASKVIQAASDMLNTLLALR